MPDLAQNVDAAKAALQGAVAGQAEGTQFDPAELTETARNGWSSEVMACALLELIDENKFEVDAARQLVLIDTQN